MKARYRKICFLCGKEYQYCSNCKDFRTQPTWKNMFDTENCYKIFSLGTEFAQGTYTKEEAKEILNAYDLSDIGNFKIGTVEQIKIIQSDDNKDAITNNVDTEQKIENDKVEDIKTEDIISEASTFKKKKKSMKKVSEKKVFNEQ